MLDPLHDIAVIDEDLAEEAAVRSRHHRRCDARCQAWRDHNKALDELLDLRLRFMDRRDTAQLETV